MEDVMKADVFFFVTTIAIAIMTIGFIVVCVYVVRILSDVRAITQVLKEGGVSLISHTLAIPKTFERGVRSFFRVLVRRLKDKERHDS